MHAIPFPYPSDRFSVPVELFSGFRRATAPPVRYCDAAWGADGQLRGVLALGGRQAVGPAPCSKWAASGPSARAWSSGPSSGSRSTGSLSPPFMRCVGTASEVASALFTPGGIADSVSGSAVPIDRSKIKVLRNN